MALFALVACSSAQDGGGSAQQEQQVTYCDSLGSGDLHIQCGGGGTTSSSGSTFTPAIPNTGTTCSWTTEWCAVQGYWLNFSNAFEAQLSSACGGVTMAYVRYEYTGGTHWKTLACLNTPTLQSFLSAHGMTASSIDSCDACVGNANYGYVFVDWDATYGAPVCPSGCACSNCM